MLVKLKLNNFRQHKDTVLEFIPGINTIVGENNSGKSTIPEAIEFALYGSRALRDSAKGYITDGEADGSAIVRLQLGSSEYTIGRNSKNAELRKDGILEGQYKDNVSKDVCTITGVNQTGYRLGHYVRQKELAAFSNMRPGKRHETIERMLKVNAVDKVIIKLKEELTGLELTRKGLLAKYADIETLEKQRQELEAKVLELEFKGKDLETTIAGLMEQQTNLRALQDTRNTIVLNNTNAEKLLAQWEQATLKVDQAKEELNIAETELSDLDWSAYEAVLKAVKEIRVLEVKSAEMLSIKKILDEELIEPEVVIKPEEVDKSELQTLNAKIDLKQTQLDSLQSLVDKPCCPTCQQPLTNVVNLVAELKGELQELIKLRNAEDKLLSSAIQAYTKANTAYLSYKSKQAVHLDKLTRRSELLTKYTDIEFDSEKKKELELELKELQTVKEKAISLESKIATLRTNLEMPVKPDVEILEVPEDLSIELTNLDLQVKDLNTRYRQQASDLATANAYLETAKEDLNKALQVKEELDSITEIIASVNTEQQVFTNFKRYLTAKIRPMLQDVAETLFHKVTKNRYASYQLGSDYDISFTTHRGYIRKLSTISGSENDLACLCLRLAIATLRSTKLAGSLGFVILDEISGSFDDERTRQTLEGLIELKDVIPQIINITHKPVEMKFADRLFTVKETNGLATVTVQ